MKIPEIIENLNNGKYIVWIDDKQNAALTPEYMESHFVRVVDSIEDGDGFCTSLQEEERKATGVSATRYRITSLKEDFVCSEDLDQEKLSHLSG